MQVKEIMTTNPECAEPSTPLEDVAMMMADCDCGGIPVCEPGTRRLVGFVTDRDIVLRTLAKGLDPLEMIASDAMSTNIHTVRPESDIDECVRTMENYKVRRVPVTDEQGQVVGIVSQADLIRRAIAMQPEIIEEFEEALEGISEPRSSI